MFAGIIANACPQISGHHKSNNNVAVKGSDGNNFAHNRFWGVVDVLGRSKMNYENNREVCNNVNDTGCTWSFDKFLHVSKNCKQDHPLSRTVNICKTDKNINEDTMHIHVPFLRRLSSAQEAVLLLSLN